MRPGPRCRCLVPHCQRTRGQRKGEANPPNPRAEWICAKHWSAVPRRWRAVERRAERRLAAAWEAGTYVSPDSEWFRYVDRDGMNRYFTPTAVDELQRAWLAYRRTSARCKRYAIEAALGI